MLKQWLCQADIQIHLSCVDPVLIKSGYATIDGPDMVPVSTYRNGKQEYFFPGSSLKGVLRSHSERIIRTLRQDMVCVPYIQNANDAKPNDDLHQGCGSQLDLKDTNGRKISIPSWDVYRLSCPICRTFGSLKFSGRATISDAYPTGTVVVENRDGVGIDRFTGGTVPGAKFELSIITSGNFEATITLRNFEKWQLGLFHYLLIDLKDKILRVGSGKSRGLGRVTADVQSFRVAYAKPQQHLVGLHELTNSNEQTRYGLLPPGPNAPADLPVSPEIRGLRHIYDLTGSWETQTVSFAPQLYQFLQTGYSFENNPVSWKEALKRFVQAQQHPENVG